MAHDAIDLSSGFGIAAFPAIVGQPAACLDGALQFEPRISANSCQKPHDDFPDATGASWNPRPSIGVYANWSQGFLPPATEELANNPDAMGGFNTHLVPASSMGEEVGARGVLPGQLHYDLTLFHLSTDNDFGRYRVTTRPLETFYQNAGSSRRYGVEAELAWYPTDALSLEGVYTYSNFKYTNIKSLFALAASLIIHAAVGLACLVWGSTTDANAERSAIPVEVLEGLKAQGTIKPMLAHHWTTHPRLSNTRLGSMPIG